MYLLCVCVHLCVREFFRYTISMIYTYMHTYTTYTHKYACGYHVSVLIVYLAFQYVLVFHCCVWLTRVRKLWGMFPSSHLSHYRSSGMRDIFFHTWLYMASGDSNAGPHACRANTLFAGPSLSSVLDFHILDSTVEALGHLHHGFTSVIQGIFCSYLEYLCLLIESFRMNNLSSSAPFSFLFSLFDFWWAFYCSINLDTVISLYYLTLLNGL